MRAFWDFLKSHGLGMWNHMKVCRICKFIVYAETVILIVLLYLKCT